MDWGGAINAYNRCLIGQHNSIIRVFALYIDDNFDR